MEYVEIRPGLWVNREGKFKGLQLWTFLDSQKRYVIVNHGATKYLAHRLVAEAFCERPDLGEELVVDHLNGVPDDNRAENLEWVTQSENLRRAFRGRVGNNATETTLLCKGEIIDVFPSKTLACEYAEKTYGVPSQTLYYNNSYKDYSLKMKKRSTKKHVSKEGSKNNTNGKVCYLYVDELFEQEFTSIRSAAIYAHENFGVSVTGLIRNKKSGNCFIEY